MGCEGIRGRTGARAWEVIHIYTGSFTPSPDPTPFYRRLISTRKGGLTTNGIHLLIPASLSNRSGPPHCVRHPMQPEIDDRLCCFDGIHLRKIVSPLGAMWSRSRLNWCVLV